jgi:hypothetical protein
LTTEIELISKGSETGRGEQCVYRGAYENFLKKKIDS